MPGGGLPRESQRLRRHYDGVRIGGCVGSLAHQLARPAEERVAAEEVIGEQFIDLWPMGNFGSERLEYAQVGITSYSPIIITWYF